MPRYIEENEIYKLFSSRGVAQLHVGDIDVLPRAEAKEVVHGRWKPVYDEDDLLNGIYYQVANACSACGKTVGWLHDGYAYCPNCGAEMDKRS